MIPEVQKFTDNHYITNLYIKPPTDKEINEAKLNELFYRNIDKNICKDDVLLSMSMSIDDMIHASPDDGISLDTIVLPKDYISEMDIDRLPSIGYLFIHTSDDSKMMDVDINA